MVGKVAVDPVPDYYSWRLPRKVLALANFDIPALHQREPLVPAKIRGLTAPRMAGHLHKPDPFQIRDTIRKGDFDDVERGYFRELLQSFDPFDARMFQVYGGITRYELARTMIAARITQPLLCEWMNCHVPGYESTLDHHRTWDSGWMG